jgi:hypothetical protein
MPMRRGVTRFVQNAIRRPAMANRFSETDPRRDKTGGIDAEDLVERVRRFAHDAQRVLSRPDSPIDEMIDLHRRAWSLLDESGGAQTAGISRWLRSVRDVIAARLRAWAVEELDSLVA